VIHALPDLCEEMTGQECQNEEGAIVLPPEDEAGVDLGSARGLMYLDHDGKPWVHTFEGDEDVVVWGFEGGQDWPPMIIIQGGDLRVTEDGLKG